MKKRTRLLLVNRLFYVKIGVLGWILSICSMANGNTAYTGMRNITALELAADMGVGWNLGNTLDAHCSYKSGVDSEVCWNNPYTTKAMIDAIARKGFKTLRIPTTWHNHIGTDPEYSIDPAWMDRVEEVANYAFDNDMYVIINLHHENDWVKLTDNAQEQILVKKKLAAIWKQIATRFKDYGDYLIFETLNEPADKEVDIEMAQSVINMYNKRAVNAIRNSGGNNSERFLMVPGYFAWGGVNLSAIEVPDNNSDKIMLSWHWYAPYFFAQQFNDKSNSESEFSQAHRDEINNEFKDVYDKYISKGRAVIIGEFGARNKDNAGNRMEYASYYTTKAKEYGITPIWWDNGGKFTEVPIDNYAIFKRETQTWFYEGIANALVGLFNYVEAEEYDAMKGVKSEATSDVGGGLNLGWISSGDWINYNIDIPEEGQYKISYRVASNSSNGIIQLRSGGAIRSKTAIPNTGGMQNWETISSTVNLPKGKQVIRLYAQIGGWNLNWFKMNYQGNLKSSSVKELTEDKLHDKMNQNLVIYPNPADDVINLSFEGFAEFEIYNTSGSIVKKGVLNEDDNRINISSFVKGFYILIITNGLKIEKHRFIKK